MSSILPTLDKLRPNSDWAKLPLFDRKRWKQVAFGEFAESVNKRVEPSEAAEEIYVGLEHLDPQSLHVRRWGKGSDVIGTKLRFEKGDIIFGRRRAYQRKLAVAEFEGICSAHAMVVRGKPKMVLPEFLPFLMMSDKFMNRAIEISVGSLSPTINWKTLKLEEFPLPPLDQQKRIAEILWAVDESLEKWLSTKNDVERLRSSYATEGYFLWGSHSRSLQNRQPLSELAEINPPIATKLDDNTEVSFITMADVSENGYVINSVVKKYMDVRKGFTTFCDGDILFAKITPCMENGKGAIVTGLKNGIGFGSTEFHVIRPKSKDDTDFIYHLTMAPQFRVEAKRYMRGSAGQQRVPTDFLSNYGLFLPPIKQRKVIGATLTDITHQIADISGLQSTIYSLNVSFLNSIFG